jgi:hypothetical protein
MSDTTHHANQSTIRSTGFSKDFRKVSLGSGIIGAAILSPVNKEKPKKTQLPRLPIKRSPNPTTHPSLYSTRSGNPAYQSFDKTFSLSMNPYKALVATSRNKKEIGGSKYIGIHHCSIEFNSSVQNPGIPISDKEESNRNRNSIISQSLDIPVSRSR